MLLLKPGPGTREIWTLKCLGLKDIDPEKHGIDMGLKNMTAFRVSNKENVQCDL